MRHVLRSLQVFSSRIVKKLEIPIDFDRGLAISSRFFRCSALFARCWAEFFHEVDSSLQWIGIWRART
jgi:hypothetical protein